MNTLTFLTPNLAEKINEIAEIQSFKKGTEILRKDQYIKVLPIVLNGLVKVYSQ